jgi:hypothetical protein
VTELEYGCVEVLSADTAIGNRGYYIGDKDKSLSLSNVVCRVSQDCVSSLVVLRIVLLPFVVASSIAMSEAAPAVSASGYVSTQPYRPPFLQSPGRPPIPWQRWLAMFEDWLLAIGFPEAEAM